MYINHKKNFYNNTKLLSNFLQSKNDGVFYIGHASILVRLNNKKYIFDAI